MQEVEIGLEDGVLGKEMAHDVLALHFEFGAHHAILPVLQGFAQQVVAEEPDLLDSFVELDLFPEFADGVKLVLVLFVIADSSQRYGQVLFFFSVLVLDDIEGIGQVSSVHIAELFIEVGVVFEDF